MLLVPTACTPDRAAVLGVTVTLHALPAGGGGSLGRGGSLGTLGRWVLWPATGVLAYACATDGGGAVLFSVHRPRERTYVASVLGRPTVPGGDPTLLTRLSSLLVRVTSDGGTPPQGAPAGAPGNPPPSPLVAARRFFAAQVGTFGVAAAAATADVALPGVDLAAAGPPRPAVSATILRMEVGSASVVAHLRAAALASAGVHPGGSASARRGGWGCRGGFPPASAPRAGRGALPPPLRPPGSRRSPIQLSTVVDERERARIVKNRQAARRSNAKRKARAEAAKRAASAGRYEAPPLPPRAAGTAAAGAAAAAALRP
ncbi:hypothetical protein BU14_0293s0001 [Porphyra umbilicalis]|uniref:BZIP domain-containing protein n=1 Tax=Porphyra umbilicalis TaxID=2786 RepID=A0A1X6P0P4_PORUM|nr:hypothetical protein BU14_0293s0001 [Porphyra umbilicalis]|eukprot:OSX74330.1 hypothetical protein BU14_0293s0001 [Porphyra umbilicalis]